MGLFSKKKTTQKSNSSAGGAGNWMLYLYFDVQKTKQKRKGSIAEVCYQELYRAVLPLELIGALLFAGDCLSDQRKFIIGVGAQLNQLQTIQQHMEKSAAFKEICADPPTRLLSEALTNMGESLVYDGMIRLSMNMLPDGNVDAYVESSDGGTGWAKIAWDNLKK